MTRILQISIFLVLALSVAYSAERTPSSVTVEYSDGSKVVATSPFTPSQTQAIASLLPPVLEVVKVPVKADDGTVLDGGGDGLAVVTLKTTDRIYIEAEINGPAAKVIFDVNGSTSTESATPWTYGKQFAGGWSPKPGLYTVTVTPYYANGKAGTSKLLKVNILQAPVVVVPPPATVPTVPAPTPTTPTTTGTVRNGKADWTFKLDSSGWIVYPRQANCVDIFVSASAGNDTNPGTATKPVKTVARARKLVKANQQFFMWLQGDYNYGTLPEIPSGTREFPNVVRSWGITRARLNNVTWFGKTGLALVDIKTVGDSSPTTRSSGSVGINTYNSDHIVIEGCAVSEFQNGLVMRGAPDKYAVNNITRRNVVYDNHSDKTNLTHSQGLYLEHIDGFLDEENYFDSNGWKAGVADRTMFNHNKYENAENKNTLARGSYYANAAATGSQERAGGDVTYCVYHDNPVQLTYGLVNGSGPQKKGGVSGLISHLVFQMTKPITNIGSGVALTLANCKDVTVDSVIATDSQYWVLAFERGTGNFEGDAQGMHNVTVSNLIAWSAAYGVYVKPDLDPKATGKNSVSNVVVKNSFIKADTTNQALARVVRVEAPLSGRFREPRTIDDYARFIGLKDRQDLVRASRQQSRATWRKELEPRSIVSWIEAGFVNSN